MLKWWLGTVVLLLLLAGIIGYSMGLIGADPEPLPNPRAGEAAPGTPAESTGALRRSDGGAVELAVTFANLTGAQPNGDLVFQVEMNTHSVDLDAIDLARAAVLFVEPGGAVGGLVWQPDGGGGHHISGKLTARNQNGSGQPLLTPATRSVTLALANVAGVPERTFRWVNDGWLSGQPSLPPAG